ncbi:MAG: glycosyl hydrolase [Maribacter sp.]
MKKVNFAILTLLVFNFSLGQNNTKNLIGIEFVNPDKDNRPSTWMHVMNSNLSKVGLTKDLEAMADVGIGGIILFNVSAFIKNGDEKFNSTEHLDKIGHAAAECERLGLSFGVHNCDGWTSSGDPWVTAEHSTKQIVHREMVVKGGDINVQLPEPTKRSDYYKDVSVIAYPALDAEVIESKITPEVTSSSSDFNTDMIIDGKIDDLKAKVIASDGNETIKFNAEVNLADSDRKYCNDEISFALDYQIYKDKTVIKAKRPSKKRTGDTLVLPLISPTGEKVIQTSENSVEFHKAEGVVVDTSNVAIKIKNTQAERIFNQVPGMEVVPLLLVFHKEIAEISCTIQIS